VLLASNDIAQFYDLFLQKVIFVTLLLTYLPINASWIKITNASTGLEHCLIHIFILPQNDSVILAYSFLKVYILNC